MDERQGYVSSRPSSMRPSVSGSIPMQDGNVLYTIEPNSVYNARHSQTQIPIMQNHPGPGRSPRALPVRPDSFPPEMHLNDSYASSSSSYSSLSYSTPLNDNSHRNGSVFYQTTGGNYSAGSFLSATSTMDGTGMPVTHPHNRKSISHGPYFQEIPVPSQYLDLCTEKSRQEFHHVRYTAVTVDPDEFNRPEHGYLLRQKLMNRVTELFIVITMYNEDDELFTRTMTAAMKNIAYLCNPSNPRTWGPMGWTHAVVCIVADGRSKIHPRVLSVLGAQGIYPLDHNLSNNVNGKPVKAHLFEFTTQISINSEGKLVGIKDGLVPVQVLFCLKEKNAKKINSHRWFLDAFAQSLQPNVCILLDVGTKPTKHSFYHLWKAFELDPNCGGACGEIRAQINSQNIWNPLVAAQNFEYKMSNILDKPLESVFGYIQVLPGAFSAYRFDAIQNYGVSSGPLASYFKGETLHSGEADVFAANMYLAEDRILCLEVVTKKNSKWKLKYVKDAKADTDVPTLLPELVSQRRRWLNGSFFAAVHSLTNSHLFFRSKHSILRKFLFAFQTLYNAGNLMLTWFSIGNMYLTFYFLFDIVFIPSKDPFQGAGPVVFEVLRNIYVAALACQFIMSFGNRPQGSKALYYALSWTFSLIMLCMLFLGSYTVYYAIPKSADEWKQIGSLIKQPAFRDIVISLGSTYGIYMISSLLYLDPWHILTSMVQYLLLLPTYVNVFMIYSFCNLHDISWGTKGDNQVQGATASSAHNTAHSSNEMGAKHTDKDKSPSPTKTMEEINQMYRENLHRIQNKPPPEKSGRDRQTRIDDYFKMYRTRVVLFWIFSNALLVLLFTNPTITRWINGPDGAANRKAVSGYLAFIFWTVTAFSCIRFLGSIAYLVIEISNRTLDLATRGKSFVPFRVREQQRISRQV